MTFLYSFLSSYSPMESCRTPTEPILVPWLIEKGCVMPGYEVAPIWKRSCTSERRKNVHRYIVKGSRSSVIDDWWHSPVDIDWLSWDGDTADNPGTRCSPVCCASCRYRTVSRRGPALFVIVSPASDTLLFDFETRPETNQKRHPLSTLLLLLLLSSAILYTPELAQCICSVSYISH